MKGRDNEMKLLQIEAESTDYIMQPNALNKEEVRVLDKCRHFLGKILEGRIYVYCRRCKRFVLVHNH